MADTFKVGSISSLINKTNKKAKKMKKNLMKDEQEDAKVVVEPNQSIPEIVTPKAKSKKKRKLSETVEEPEQEKVVQSNGKKQKKKLAKANPESEEPKKKKNKAKKQKAKLNETYDKSVEVESAEVPEETIVIEKENDPNDQNNSSDGAKKIETLQEKIEKNKRTLFVGNLPADFALKTLKQTLKQFGKVRSIRVRSVAPAKITLSKKTAFLSKQINANKKNVNAYVIFDSPASVDAALQLNGKEYEDHILQVDRVDLNPTYDATLSIFLGNLSFKATEDEVRKFFEDCGEIKNVRLIRDGKTGIGKGFGYVNFHSKDSVVLALQKDGQSLNGRDLRVQSTNYSNKNDKNNPKGSIKKDMKPSNADSFKKEKPNGQFSGEKANKKKFAKKSLKNKVKSNKIKKQGKKVAEILSK